MSEYPEDHIFDEEPMDDIFEDEILEEEENEECPECEGNGWVECEDEEGYDGTEECEWCD